MVDAKLNERVKRAVLAVGARNFIGVQTSLDDKTNIAIFDLSDGDQLHIAVPEDFSDTQFSTSVKELIQLHISHADKRTVKVKVSVLRKTMNELQNLASELEKTIGE
jgi:hypothetical protein